MKYLTAGLSGLLLVLLTIADASASSITLTKSDQPEPDIDFELCYQHLLNAEKQPYSLRSFQAGSLDSPESPQPIQNCADLFELLYEHFQEAAIDHTHPNFFPKAYYDFLLTDKVVATVRAKINKQSPTTAPPTTADSTTAVSTEITTTEASATSEKFLAMHDAESLPKSTPLININVIYTDAQIRALIVNIAHMLMTNTWTVDHAFCTGPFLNKASYLGCNAVMARFFLSEEDQFDYYVLTPGQNSEEALRKWIENRSIVNPPTILVVTGHVNVMNTLNLDYFRGIAGMPDLTDDHFDPMEPLSNGERSMISTHTHFNSDCETFSPGTMSSLFCNHAAYYFVDHGNGLIFGDNPSISGVDLEATLHRTNLAFNYQDEAGEIGKGSRSYPAYLIHSQTSDSNTIVNSHIRLHIVAEQDRTFKKRFNYKTLSPPRHHDHDVYLFYSSSILDYIFSKTSSHSTAAVIVLEALNITQPQWSDSQEFCWVTGLRMCTVVSACQICPPPQKATVPQLMLLPPGPEMPLPTMVPTSLLYQ